MSPTASNRTQPVTNRSLQNQFISMPEKKIVAIEDNLSCLAIKSSTEVKAHKWFMTLSQYCFVAPTMEGNRSLCKVFKAFHCLHFTVNAAL